MAEQHEQVVFREAIKQEAQFSQCDNVDQVGFVDQDVERFAFAVDGKGGLDEFGFELTCFAVKFERCSELSEQLIVGVQGST